MSEESFPDVCVKCNAPIRASIAERHFRASHGDAIGRATFARDPEFSREFLYLRPVPGVLERVWYVIWLDWPVQVVRLVKREWIIGWPGTDPGEGEG